MWSSYIYFRRSYVLHTVNPHSLITIWDLCRCSLTFIQTQHNPITHKGTVVIYLPQVTPRDETTKRP